jgi:hypothetical protein
MSDIIMEVNVLTGEIIERELNETEIAERNNSQSAFEAQLAEQDAKAAARTSALAKLAELGLTAEEIAAL